MRQASHGISRCLVPIKAAAIIAAGLFGLATPARAATKELATGCFNCYLMADCSDTTALSWDCWATCHTFSIDSCSTGSGADCDPREIVVYCG